METDKDICAWKARVVSHVLRFLLGFKAAYGTVLGLKACNWQRWSKPVNRSPVCSSKPPEKKHLHTLNPKPMLERPYPHLETTIVAHAQSSKEYIHNRTYYPKP